MVYPTGRDPGPNLRLNPRKKADIRRITSSLLVTLPSGKPTYAEKSTFYRRRKI
jgi:hypothetical protein